MTTLPGQVMFGDLLKTWRRRCGATQQQLADLSTVSVRAIRDLEFGRVARPRADTIRLVADALGLTGRTRADFEAAAGLGRGGDALIADETDTVLPPAPLDGLVGREAEVSVLQESLSSGAERLVTVVGLAGVGKTRLALEVAGLLHNAHGLPVLWAGAASPSGAYGARHRRESLIFLVETALTGQATGGTAFDQLSSHIRDRPMLVVLDGYHPSEIHTDAVLALLHECRHLRVLITARAPLDIAGRWLLPLGPLAVPSPGDDVSDLAMTPSVRLLLRHVRHARADFVIGAGNADAIGALCRRLDGIPIALVALASWFLFYEPATLLNQVDGDPFDVMDHAVVTGEVPDLRVLLGRIVEGLDDGERVLLDALAGLDAAWSATEAATLASLPVAACVRMLRRLTVFGVVRPISGPDGVRFRALELVRFLRAPGVRGPQAQAVVPRPRAVRVRVAAPRLRIAVETAGLLPG